MPLDKEIESPLEKIIEGLDKIRKNLNLISLGQDFNYYVAGYPHEMRFERIKWLLESEQQHFKIFIRNQHYRDFLIKALHEGDVRKNVAQLVGLISGNKDITRDEINLLLKSIPENLLKRLYVQHTSNLATAQEDRGLIVSIKPVFESWLRGEQNIPQRLNQAVAIHFIEQLQSEISKHVTANAVELGKQVINNLEQSHRKQVRLGVFQSSSSTKKIKKAYADTIKHFLTNSLFTPEQQKELLAYSCREGSFASHRQWKFWSSDETQTTKNLKQWKPGSPISDDVDTPAGDIELRQITF